MEDGEALKGLKRKIVLSVRGCVCVCVHFIWKPKRQCRRERLRAGRPVFLMALVIEDEQQ